jgi:hypothetical protein
VSFAPVNVSGSAQAPSLLVSAGEGPILLFNSSASVTVSLGDDQFDCVAGDLSTTSPLPPLATAVFDGKKSVYGAALPGQSALISRYPGGLNFFQLVELLVKILLISASAGNGLFAYSGAPGAGDLIASIVGVDSFDPFSNQAYSGFTAYAGQNANDLFMSLRAASLVWGTNANGSAGTAGLFALGGGARILGGLLATDPATGNTDEDWHDLGAPNNANGWAIAADGYAKCKLLVEANMAVFAFKDVTVGTAADNTVIWTASTVPAAYRPATSARRTIYTDQIRVIAGGPPTTSEGAGLLMAATGAIQCEGIAAAATRIDGCFLVPTDI